MPWAEGLQFSTAHSKTTPQTSPERVYSYFLLYHATFRACLSVRHAIADRLHGAAPAAICPACCTCPDGVHTWTAFHATEPGVFHIRQLDKLFYVVWLNAFLRHPEG